MTFSTAVSGKCVVYAYGEGANGSFYIDDVQLEEGEAPSNYNLLENGDLQTTTFAYAWTLNEDASYCTDVGVNATGVGNQSIRIEGDCENNYARAYQTVQVGQSCHRGRFYVLTKCALCDTMEWVM